MNTDNSKNPILSKNVSSSNGLEPLLRFPEFTEKYTQVKLGSISKRVQRKNASSTAPIMMLSASSGFIMQSEKYSRDNAGQSLSKYTILNKGELAYNHGASKLKPYGCCFELKEDSARIPYVYHCFSIYNQNVPYIATLLNNQKTDKQLKKLISSSVRMDGLLNISYDEYMGIDIFIPSLPEQKKIADFLSLVDERIEQQRQLVEALKRYKRGVINGIFDNKLYGQNWNNYKLSDILKERNTFCEKDGTFEHVTLSKDGISPKTERYDRDYLVASDDKRYKITKLYDICYNPANMKFGVICLNTYGNAIFSPIYVTFEIANGFNKNIVAFCLTRQNFINKTLKYQQGTVYERMAVSPEDLLSMNVELPDLESQTKLSKQLLLFEELINTEKQQLFKLEKLRRCFLQQMFI